MRDYRLFGENRDSYSFYKMKRKFKLFFFFIWGPDIPLTLFLVSVTEYTRTGVVCCSVHDFFVPLVPTVLEITKY